MREIAVWVAGGVGLTIVARAAALYRGSDRLAFALVALIALGLMVGIAELVARVRRANAIAREVAAMPSTPTEDHVERASEPVRAFLRARISGTAVWSGAPPFAAYLIGLLVMIGLLGTFLGLFESLRGAREALAAAADPATLRAGLSAPIDGLSRAFGTSAAGVSASAMLGLALVASRRAEAAAQLSLAAYASGPLASLSVARRTLAALESIAQQGSVLPHASDAMAKGAASLAEVTVTVREELRGVAGALREDVRGLTGAVRDDLRGAAEATARGVAEAMAPRLDASVAAVGASARAQAESLGKNVHEAIAREAKTVSEAIVATRDLLLEAELTRAEASARALRASSETVSESLLAMAEEIAAKLAADGDRARAGDARLAALLEKIEAVTQALPATHERSAEKLAAELAAHGRNVEESARALLRTEADQTAALLRAHVEQTSSVLQAQVEQTSSVLRTETAESAARLRDFADQTAASLQLHADGGAARLTELIDRLERVRAELRAEDQTRAFAMTEQLESQLRSHLESLAGSVATSLDAVVRSSAAAPEAAARIIDDASARLRQQLEAEAAREARLGELVERVGSLASSVESASAARLDAHATATSDALEAHLEALALSVGASLGGVMSEAERAHANAALREQQLTALLARFDGLASRIDAQSEKNEERLLEHELKLEEVYAKSASAWTERLALHQASIEEGVLRTGVAVREAAEALTKGSTEMGALGELFGASVERYREASEKWLTGLSLMRTAAERVAEADAQDLLAAYLEQTREVFDQTVAFQRQLFTELRRPAEVPRLEPLQAEPLAHVRAEHPVGEAE